MTARLVPSVQPGLLLSLALHLILFLPPTASLATAAVAQDEGDRASLVVLAETGETRDGLPVYRIHPDAARIAARLGRGLPATMLRVYGMVQAWRQREDGIAPEPAYLLMSSQQGGFARYGFFLDGERKEGVAYVDLHREWPLTGRFGAMDQLFPHELFHALRRQLVGPLAGGHANQVHALGVRTDRGVAFNEGVAEHFQALAIDHPDAAAETAALAHDREAFEAVERQLGAYRRELTASLAVATRMRMGFLVWYSNAEDVLRYRGVKENRYARRTEIPRRLLGDDPYRAYLLESVLPGSPGASLESLSRMVSTEGVVAAMMYRWAVHRGLRTSYREPAFYGRFGVSAAEVDPLENVYLKLMYVLRTHRPAGLLEMMDGYRESFPDEAGHLDELAGEVFMRQEVDRVGQIWLANADFRTGTTLFDQFRGMPRVHTFDLNGASVVDLVGVPGVDRELATHLRDAAPYRSLEDLQGVEGVDGDLLARFRDMQSAMETLLEEGGDEGDLSLRRLLMPYVWRLLIVLAVATLAGGVLHHAVLSAGGSGEPRARESPALPRLPISRLRSGVDGVAAASLGIPGGWLVGGAVAGLGSLAVVGVLLGLPAAVWHLGRRHDARGALRILGAWLAAAAPAAVLVTPWI